MIEKDNIQELFSKAFENQTTSVRPDLWAGVQAKMAAAGVASTATVAAKGLSALTKWIIGSAAVGTVGVVTTVIALNSGEESTNKKTDSPKEISQNISVLSPEEESEKTEQAVKTENTYTVKQQETKSIIPFEDIPKETNPQSKELKKDPTSPAKEVNNSLDDIKLDKGKLEDKVIPADNNKEFNQKTDSKKASVDKKDDAKETTPVVKHPEDTKEPVFADLDAKVTKFPTMFTPNGDTRNDTYFVEVENISDFRLIIKSQDGIDVFVTNDPNASWDGSTFNGEKAKDGMYAAIVTGKQQNGKNFRDIQLFELRR